MKLYSIGHSNVEIGKFLSLLDSNSIEILVDVRSRPFSRFSPQFNRARLEKSLSDAGIEYMFMGDLLGGRPEGEEFYLAGGKIDYDRLAQAEFYLQGIERLLEIAGARRTAVMCAEADFRNCHRYNLITRSLTGRGAEVRHILRTGELIASHPSEFDSQESRLF